MLGKICCFGELLLRFSPTDDWLDTHQLPFFLGGSELNVAQALNDWALPTQYITALPDHYLSTAITAELSSKGIDVQDIVLTGDRIGMYFLPIGSELKNTEVIYDRNHSGFSTLKKGTIDWKKALKNTSWVHISAITPALNDDVAAVCLELLESASSLGITISLDLNYRKQLWHHQPHPERVIEPLLEHCDLIMGNLWSVSELTSIKASVSSSQGQSKTQLVQAGFKSIDSMRKRFQKVQKIAYTYRMATSYFAVMQTQTEQLISQTYPIAKIIDKVGTGDCFMAGLIYSAHNQLDDRSALALAVAAAVGKHQIAGDATQQLIDDIKKNMLQ